MHSIVIRLLLKHNRECLVGKNPKNISLSLLCNISDKYIEYMKGLWQKCKLFTNIDTPYRDDTSLSTSPFRWKMNYQLIFYFTIVFTFVVILYSKNWHYIIAFSNWSLVKFNQQPISLESWQISRYNCRLYI